MSSLKEKAFYIWSNERKKEPRKECQGKSCPLYKDRRSWIDCDHYVSGWCNHSEYGVPVDEPLLALKDAEKELDELKQKLQQLFKEFPDINSKDYALHNGWTNHDLKDRYGLFIADVQAWKKKFEEWLKEEKEAQP